MSIFLQNPDLHQSGFWVFIGFLGRNVLHFVQCRQKPVVSQDFPPCSWILFFLRWFVLVSKSSRAISVPFLRVQLMCHREPANLFGFARKRPFLWSESPETHVLTLNSPTL